MSQRLERNLPLLKVLHSCKPKFRKLILKESPKDLVYCLCEVISNFLEGNIPIEKEKLQKLKKHKQKLFSLAAKKGGHKKKNTIKEKRQILVQSGGFLPAILGPLLGIATSLISNLIN